MATAAAHAGHDAHHDHKPSFFARWFLSTNHKDIGTLYLIFAIFAGISIVLGLIYHVGFLRARNATPGKMMLGLSVRRVDQPGRLAVGTAFMRMLLPLSVGVFSLIPLVSYLVFFVTLADLIWPAKDPRRQALHDKIAGTQVVRGRQPR